jgi:UDP-glucose 4-epimerase
MRVLVIGGAGYIGSVIVEELIHAGHQAIVYDSLVRGHIDAIHPEAQFVLGDIHNRVLLTQTMRERQVEAVIHMAAFIEVAESVAHPETFFYNNVAGSVEVLEAMVETGVKKIVFSSTGSLYGNTDRQPISESEPTAPTNPYAQSKLMVEQMLHWMSATHGLTATALRYFNAAGATKLNGEVHQPESHLIPLVLRAAMNDTSLSLFGTDYPTRDGTCIRDYIHVIDLAQAHLLALGRTDSGMQVYNVGNGNGYTNREVIQSVERVTGQQLNVIVSDRRPGDPVVIVASPEKIRRELGWNPQHAALDTIVESAWNWLVAHPNGYAR